MTLAAGVAPHRPEVDDGPTTGLLHRPHRGPAQEERAADVDVHDPMPCVVARSVGVGAHDGAGRVDEHVESPVLGDGLGYGPIAERRIGHVAADRGAADLDRGALGTRSIEVDHDDVITLLGEKPCRRRPHPRGPTRHHHDSSQRAVHRPPNLARSATRTDCGRATQEPQVPE